MDQSAWVDKDILELARVESDLWCPKETGGALMGYWSDQNVVITDIIGPGPDAVHKRYSFTPDDHWHAKEIARIYRESGRITTYLGDWHSHPFGTPGLSINDLITLFRLARYKPARTPRPIMGILHNNPQWKLEMGQFALSKIFSGEAITAMKVILYNKEKD